MSSYLNFYMRGADESENQNHYLCSYSRGSRIYQIFNAPYGRLTELTTDLLREYLEDARGYCGRKTSERNLRKKGCRPQRNERAAQRAHGVLD